MDKKKAINEMCNHPNSFTSILTKEQQDELTGSIIVEKFKKNEVIYKEGEVPQYMHCLVEGKVKLYKEGVGGRTQIMRLMNSIQYFGYRAYFANQNYINNAGAFENCTICLIPIDIIEKLMNENHKLAIHFVRLLATELGASDERLVNLTQKHIRGRLSEALLFLLDSYGFADDGETLDINISREDIASISNMTTSNAIRTLSAFQKEGLISIYRRRISLKDIDALKRICKIG